EAGTIPWRRRMMTFAFRLALVLSIFIVSYQRVEASGFSIYDLGAEEQAQGDAVAAQVESPAAVFYNPAGMADLGGTHLEVGTSILSSRTTFQSEVSNTETNIHPGPFFPSYLFMTKELSSRWSIGFGIFSSIGNDVEYP